MRTWPRWAGWLAVLCACDGGGGAGAGEQARAPIPLQGSDEADAQQRLCTPPFAACGGDVLGSWDVSAVCFENPATFLPATREPDCADVVREAQARAAGHYEFREDGTRTIDLRLELDLDTLWTDACVEAISGDDTLTAVELCPGLQDQYASQSDIASVECETQGEDCVCLISTVTMSEQSSSDYEVQDETVAGSPFCADGDALRISMTAMGLTGTIVLQRSAIEE